jgi:hypothetical protein
MVKIQRGLFLVFSPLVLFSVVKISLIFSLGRMKVFSGLPKTIELKELYLLKISL